MGNRDGSNSGGAGDNSGGAGDSDCHSCATRFADAGGCTASNPSDHIPSGCGHCGNEAMEECQNRDGSNSGGAGDNSGCTDAFEDGTMAKPWDDFDSCATEKSQGACPDGNNPNSQVDAGCQKTCGLCTESGAGDNSGCTDAFEDGTMAKPWDDFDSCATEKSQGACPD